MSAEIALQKAIRNRLATSTVVTGYVPAASILDRNERPVPDPSIIVGEATAQDDGDAIARNRVRISADLHVWKREPSTAGVKAIAGAIRTAIHAARLPLEAGFHCVDARISFARFVRDPDGETSHAIVTIESLVEEL